jgi:outer membrane receptor protein involved in Fe transport
MYQLQTSAGTFSPRLTAYHRDSLYTGLDYESGTPAYRSDAYIDPVTLWGFRLSYIPDAEMSLNFTAFVDNFTDETYFQGGFSQYGTVGSSQLVLGPGRIYGLEATIDF